MERRTHFSPPRWGGGRCVSTIIPFSKAKHLTLNDDKKYVARCEFLTRPWAQGLVPLLSSQADLRVAPWGCPRSRLGEFAQPISVILFLTGKLNFSQFDFSSLENV